MSRGKGVLRFFRLSTIAVLGCGLMLTTYAIGLAVGAGFASPSTGQEMTPPLSGESRPSLDLFWEAWEYLEQEFYGDLPPADQVPRAAIRGVLNEAGDPYTTLIDPDIAAILREDASGEFEGIGALVRLREDGYLEIVEPFKGSPAIEAGIRAGDIVIKVDGEPIKGLSIYEIIGRIRGPAGTDVRLTIVREGVKDPFEVTVTRQRIAIPLVKSESLDAGIVYIALRDFSANADQEIRSAIEGALADGARGLILDLRDNPGGFLDVAVEVASEFLPEREPILYEQFADGKERIYRARRGGLATEIPLVVLVNGGTASAAEIVAGAIQDAGRGILVGEQTFGKGSVQRVHTLSDGSELRVTVAHWFTPARQPLQDRGLTPNVVVEADQENPDQDVQLDRALEILQEELEEHP